MANSIDFTTLALGAIIGMGCRKQLKSCGRIAAATAANLAGVAAQTAAQVAEATQKSQSQSPEEEAAAEWCRRIDERIAQTAAAPQAPQAGQATGNGN